MSNNEFQLVYLINKNERRVRFFGTDFVLKNKNKCFIVYENKKYEIQDIVELEYFFKFPVNTTKEKLKIRLITIYPIKDLSKMFLDCKALISFRMKKNRKRNNIKVNSEEFDPFDNYINEVAKVDEPLFKYNINLDMFSLSSLSSGHFSSISSSSKKSQRNDDIATFDNVRGANRLENIENIESLFSNCKSLLNIEDISNWDTSKIKSFYYIFSQCSSLKSLPDISIWDTGINTNFRAMFKGCSSLLSIPDISKWIYLNGILEGF